MRARPACLLLVLAACGDRDPGLDPAVAALPLPGPLAVGPTRPFTAPGGRFRLQVPTDWKAVRSDERVTLFNPGLAEDATVDAVVFVTCGPLEANERGRSAHDILTAGESELIAGFAQQGITTTPSQQPPRAVRIGTLAGAEQTWVGKADGRTMTLWVGGVVGNETYVAVTASIVAGMEERFLPGARRMFASVEMLPGSAAVPPTAAAPTAVDAAATALTGEFAYQSMFSGGSITTVYTFAADGSVRRRTMSSGSFGISGQVGSDAGEAGTWRRSGAALQLEFGTGREDATVVSAGGQVTGLRIGQRLYGRL